MAQRASAITSRIVGITDRLRPQRHSQLDGGQRARGVAAAGGSGTGDDVAADCLGNGFEVGERAGVGHGHGGSLLVAAFAPARRPSASHLIAPRDCGNGGTRVPRRDGG